MTIEHRPDGKHQNADGLSRKPCGQCGIYEDCDKGNPLMVASVKIGEQDYCLQQASNK